MRLSASDAAQKTASNNWYCEREFVSDVVVNFALSPIASLAAKKNLLLAAKPLDFKRFTRARSTSFRTLVRHASYTMMHLGIIRLPSGNATPRDVEGRQRVAFSGSGRDVRGGKVFQACHASTIRNPHVSELSFRCCPSYCKACGSLCNQAAELHKLRSSPHYGRLAASFSDCSCLH